MASPPPRQEESSGCIICLSIFIPPLAVYLMEGGKCNSRVCLNILLCIIGFGILGICHAFYVYTHRSQNEGGAVPAANPNLNATASTPRNSASSSQGGGARAGSKAGSQAQIEPGNVGSQRRMSQQV